MRIVIDEDIPRELAPLFGGPGLDVRHVEALVRESTDLEPGHRGRWIVWGCAFGSSETSYR